MTGLAQGSPPPRTRLYRVAFVLGAALYVSCMIVGLGHEILKNRRLPAYNMSPISQAQEYLAKGDVRRAVEEYRMVALIDRAAYETPRQVAELLKGIGDASGEIDRAVFERDRFPGKAAAHRNLGWAYHANKRYPEALAAFQKALALDPADLDAQRGIANVWLDDDRYPEAIAAYERLLAARPGDAEAHNGLGIALMLAGRRDDALRSFQQAAALDPRFAANLERARSETGARP